MHFVIEIATLACYHNWWYLKYLVLKLFVHDLIWLLLAGKKRFSV